MYSDDDSDSDNTDLLSNLIEIKSKSCLTDKDIILYMFNIIKSLTKIHDIFDTDTKDYIDSFENLQLLHNTKSNNDLKLLYEEHLNILNIYKEKCQNISYMRNDLDEYINDSFTHIDANKEVKNTISNNIICADDYIACLYKEICNSCSKMTIHNTSYGKYDYCYNCVYCNSIRESKLKYEKKRMNDMLKVKLDEQYKKESKEITKSNKSKLKDKTVTINNITVQINVNQAIFNQIYVDSRDKFFQVFIKCSETNDELIKYIFMYYLCRTKAIQLFPGEKSYNKSMTYPLEAGIYTIKKHTLHGLLRYRNNVNSRITTNKIETICSKMYPNITINAHELKTIDDNRKHHCIEQLSTIINTITANNSYGSQIEEFYKSDDK